MLFSAIVVVVFFFVASKAVVARRLFPQNLIAIMSKKREREEKKKEKANVGFLQMADEALCMQAGLLPAAATINSALERCAGATYIIRPLGIKTGFHTLYHGANRPGKEREGGGDTTRRGRKGALNKLAGSRTLISTYAQIPCSS